MATPSYSGPGQPIADAGNSWLGRLGSFFGGGTPNYAGQGQPSATAAFGTTPMYAAAPSSTPPTGEVCQQHVPAECPVDANALAAGQIAIVIPRLGLPPQQ